MNQNSEDTRGSRKQLQLGIALLLTLLFILSGYQGEFARAQPGDRGRGDSPDPPKKGEGDLVEPDGKDAAGADSLALPDSLTLEQMRQDSIATALEQVRLDSIARADSISLALEQQSLYQSGVEYFTDSGWWVYGDSGFVAHSRNGVDWRELDVSTEEGLLCADGLGGELFLGGKEGNIYQVHPQGRVTAHSLDTTLAINDISLRSDGSGLCVGDEGLIAATVDSGASWHRKETPYQNRWYQVEPLGSEWLISGSGGMLVAYQGDAVQRQFIPGTSAPIRVMSVLEGEVLLGSRGEILDPLTDKRLQLPLPQQQVYDLEWYGDTLLAAVFGGIALLTPEDEQFLPLHNRYLITGIATHDQRIVAVGTHGRAWSVEFSDSLLIVDLETGARQEIPEGVVVAETTTPQMALRDTTSQQSPEEEGTVAQEDFDYSTFRYSGSCDEEIKPSLAGTALIRKVGQLNDYSPVNVAGAVLQKLYVSSSGEVIRQVLLREYPYGLNYAGTAQRVVRALTFEPAECAGQPVDAWMYITIPFDTTTADYGFIMNGDLTLHDDLRERYPELVYPQVQATFEEKQDVLRFPGRARRFVWRGDAIVEYDLDTTGQASNFQVVDESEGDFRFGQAAIDYLQQMTISPSTLHDRKIPVHVLHHVVQDRKRKEPGQPGFFGRLFGRKPDTTTVSDFYIDRVVFAWPQHQETEFVLVDELLRNHYAAGRCTDKVDTLQLQMTVVVEYGGQSPPRLQDIIAQEGGAAPSDLFAVVGNMMVAPGLSGRMLQKAQLDTFDLHLDSHQPDSCRLYPSTFSLEAPQKRPEEVPEGK